MPWRASSRVQIRALTRGVGRRSSSANIIRRRMVSLTPRGLFMVQRVDVRAREARRPRKAAEALAGPVRPRLPGGRVLLAKGLPESAPPAAGHPLVAATLPRPHERWPLPAPERHPVLPVGDPVGKVRRLPVPVVKGRGGVREVEGHQALPVRVQHHRSPDLQYLRSGKGYRPATSNPDALKYEGLRADEPSRIHRAAIRIWLSEATVPEILEGLGAGVYSARVLVHALHEHGGAGARFDLARTLNRYCLPEWRETRMRKDPWHDER